MDDRAEEQSRCVLIYSVNYDLIIESTQNQKNAPMKTILKDRECMINKEKKGRERKQSKK